MSAANQSGHEKSLTLRLNLAFGALGIILIVAVVLALYLAGRLGQAVDRTTNLAIPQSRAAFELSQHSATLTTATAGLAASRSEQQLQQLSGELTRQIGNIRNAMLQLQSAGNPQALEQIRSVIAELERNLGQLRQQTRERLDLESRQAHYATQLHTLHNDLIDTISPVIYGVTSLNRLLSKRAVRRQQRELKLQHGIDQQRLQQLNDIERARLAADSSQLQQRTASALQSLQTEGDDLGIVLDAEIRKLLQQNADNAQWSGQLRVLIDRSREHTTDHLALTLRQLQDSAVEFLGQASRNLRNALEIKSEGHLLVALLKSAADTDSASDLAALITRFNESLDLFSNASAAFLDSPLAQRNPVLAGNIRSIEERLTLLAYADSNPFGLRHGILEIRHTTDGLLDANRQLTRDLSEQVRRLVSDIEEDSRRLQAQTAIQRRGNERALILIGAVGVVLAGMISLFTIRIIKRHEKQLRQAHTIIDSTNEGVLVTDNHGIILSCNPAFRRITGYTPQEAAGQNIRILRSDHHPASFYREIWNQLTENGHWQGEIVNRRKDGSLYPGWLNVSVVRDRHQQVTHYAVVFSDITPIKQTQQKLDHLAHHDPLTGLPNRLLLLDRLEKTLANARRHRKQVGVMFLDLDRFKNINDTLGHEIGDCLLQEVGQRLRDNVRETDTVARLGGDEFMVILEELRQPDDANRLAGKLLDSLSDPVAVEDHRLAAGASIGISLFPADGQDAATLIRNADTAMYKAKSNGRNNWQFYSVELTDEAVRHFDIDKLLRRALSDDLFELFYQPQVTLDSGRIVAVETLLRLPHPERGLLPPAEFLGVAEDMGLMVELDNWVIEHACRQWQSWDAAGIAPQRIAVNLSGQQLENEAAVRQLLETLSRIRIPFDELEIEITEGFVMRNPEQARRHLQALRGMGIHLTIDDFGTGYSSMSYLKRLPIQALKIDRSFVRDIPGDADDCAITEAILALADSLRLRVVAEGVEDRAQQEFLRNKGCLMAQGYLFGRPLSATAMTQLLHEQAAA